MNESLTNIEVGLSVFSAFLSPKVVKHDGHTKLFYG